eukprot:scaffold27769_cov176-Amphora_coffeaeformis.AAC.10
MDHVDFEIVGLSSHTNGRCAPSIKYAVIKYAPGRRGLAKAVVPLEWRGKWAGGWGEGKGARGIRQRRRRRLARRVVSGGCDSGTVAQPNKTELAGLQKGTKMEGGTGPMEKEGRWWWRTRRRRRRRPGNQ